MGLFTAVIAACTVALVSSLSPKNVLIIQNKGGGQYTFLKICGTPIISCKWALAISITQALELSTHIDIVYLSLRRTR